jgi:phospholipid/cholesterol/gamma-HCH transport system permease protein
MSSSPPGYELLGESQGKSLLALSGAWAQGHSPERFKTIASRLISNPPHSLTIDGTGITHWDSLLMAFLLQCHDFCRTQGIAFDTRQLPQGTLELLDVATAVKTHEEPEETPTPWLSTLDPANLLRKASSGTRDSLAFIGEVTVAMGRLVTGRANTRLRDFAAFCYQTGPNAFGIISLTSILVGMILAYLGAVQLRQFGAEIYVADLVVIGTLREMGVLMTAVVMAGRTGAAYAAQLGTMQTNEEIDAISTMGISPIEFLVLPRMLALIIIMPLLTVYADLLGIVGGGIVAGGMGISPPQYINQGMEALSITQIAVGLIKAVVFAALIAIAGCRAGINSGRSSAAVGQAATTAVVTSVVYLIVADAAINIVFQQLGI